MTRIAALAVFALTAAPAQASGFLHIAEAKLMNHRLEIKLARKTGWDGTLGPCQRRSARRVICSFSLSRRDAEGLTEVTHYRTVVVKAGNVTTANATPVETVEG